MKKYILVDNSTDAVIGFSDSVTMDEENKVVVLLDNQIKVLFHISMLKKFETNYFKEVSDLPQDIECGKYLYTADNVFTLNHNWTKQNFYGISNDELNKIRADYTLELIEQGVI